MSTADLHRWADAREAHADRCTYEDGVCIVCGDTSPACPHGCGICDAAMAFDHFDGPYPSWTCTRPGCGAWHTAKDCCFVDERPQIPWDRLGEQGTMLWLREKR